MHKSAHAQVNASQRTKIQTPLGAQVNLPSQSVNPHCAFAGLIIVGGSLLERSLETGWMTRTLYARANPYKGVHVIMARDRQFPGRKRNHRIFLSKNEHPADPYQAIFKVIGRACHHRGDLPRSGFRQVDQALAEANYAAGLEKKFPKCSSRRTMRSLRKGRTLGAGCGGARIRRKSLGAILAVPKVLQYVDIPASKYFSPGDMGKDLRVWGTAAVPRGANVERKRLGCGTYLAIRGGFPFIPRTTALRSEKLRLAPADIAPVHHAIKPLVPSYSAHFIVGRAGAWVLRATGSESASNLASTKLTWTRSSGGKGSAHPPNILGNGYALGTINMNGYTPVILTNERPDMSRYSCFNFCTVASSELCARVLKRLKDSDVQLRGESQFGYTLDLELQDKLQDPKLLVISGRSRSEIFVHSHRIRRVGGSRATWLATIRSVGLAADIWSLGGSGAAHRALAGLRWLVCAYFSQVSAEHARREVCAGSLWLTGLLCMVAHPPPRAQAVPQGEMRDAPGSDVSATRNSRDGCSPRHDSSAGPIDRVAALAAFINSSQAVQRQLEFWASGGYEAPRTQEQGQAVRVRQVATTGATSGSGERVVRFHFDARFKGRRSRRGHSQSALSDVEVWLG
ncbi:hypothetical protein GGX14DRAFT_611168 [Mycena pura]|uniref:Uncharacterized protein n=1 Tax=Mycena pura TaxID=153505 RepID=A0AAD6VMZ4_9AGAR|nr:hypothetical protein GGX14DRAFT_611168 [Mycena pura]